MIEWKLGFLIQFVSNFHSLIWISANISCFFFHFFFPSLCLYHSVLTIVCLLIQILGGFDASNYITERKWATASDGTQIPMSIVYQKNLVKLDGSDPLVLYGYGSYEVMWNL